MIFTEHGYEGEYGLKNPFSATASQQATGYANINQDNAIDVLRGLSGQGDVAATEKLLDYYLSEQSLKTARDWTAAREDSAFQHLVEDLKKAGISPYIMSSASPSVSKADGATYNGSQLTSQENSKRSVGYQERARLISAMLAGLGIVIGASVRAAGYMAG